MSEWIAGVLEKQFNIEPERTVRVVHLLGVAGAALLFAAVATVVMSLNTLFIDQSVASLQVGDPAPRDIVAPQSPPSTTYVSAILTEQGRQNAVDNVDVVYDLPATDIARQQTQLARRILDFINNVRRDVYATTDQKLVDLEQIAALDLNEGVMLNILELDDETWRSVDEQIVTVLERVLQGSIRDSDDDLRAVTSRLPTQVSVRFSEQEAAVITAIVEDLVRPNTFVNQQETDTARQLAADNFAPVERTFVAGQIVVAEGDIITPTDYEALQQLGLLEVSPEERRQTIAQMVIRSFMVSIIVMIVIGLYIARFSPHLIDQPRFVLLAAGLYLLFLVGARVVGVSQGELYIYPTAAMALLFVAILGPEVAVISTLGLALMVGFMVGQRLELAALVMVGGLIGTLSLRRAERLNSYFFAGLMVALANVVVITIFNFGESQSQLAENVPLAPNLVLFGALNGLLSAAAAMALMYFVTVLFNLPTGLRLVELSQPNQPLLQRLLRDAPGTYQHSLQVANLSEQATNAIGGSAELVRVAALYHDIGKSLNAPFFVENQADGVNPHDEMGDPYRSADIIISHVTEGDKLARQNRLPQRVRDFVREHHGTTRVEYFYRQALSDAEDPETIDPVDFTYPGPIPRSRETAIMMLADSCESAVRARRPSSRQEIQEIVQGIIDARNRDGQLDDSGLTANDIKTIRSVFVDMLQAVFHPRINYPNASTSKAIKPSKTIPEAAKTKTGESKKSTGSQPGTSATDTKPKKIRPMSSTLTTETTAVPIDPPQNSMVAEEEDTSPMPDVPPLPRRTGENAVGNGDTEETVNKTDAKDSETNENVPDRD